MCPVVLTTNPVALTSTSLGGFDDAAAFGEGAGATDAVASDFAIGGVVGAGGLGERIEKSPGLASPDAFTFATQFAIIGTSCPVEVKANW
jgi:hypothetical protein